MVTLTSVTLKKLAKICYKFFFIYKIHNYIKYRLSLATLLKMILQHKCFPVISGKRFRTSFFIEHLRRLPLYIQYNIWKTKLSSVFEVYISLLDTMLRGRSRTAATSKMEHFVITASSC